MSAETLIASAEQKRYPLIEAGQYESVYESAYRDLESCVKSKKGFIAKIFSFNDLYTIEKRTFTDKIIRRKKEIFAGDMIEVIQKRITEAGWKAATLAELIAYEAHNIDQHTYPLFAIGLFYRHGWSCGELSRIPPTTVIPFIRKTETGNRRLDEYIVASPFGGISKPDDLLRQGSFLAVR